MSVITAKRWPSERRRQNWVSVGSVVLSADPQALGNEPPPLAHQLGELAGGKVVDGLVELVGLWSPS
jgi:hypothetical protein